MLPNFVNTSAVEIIEFEDVRSTVKDVLDVLFPNATNYSQYELEFSPDTLLRKVTPALLGRHADAATYHAWMIGITAATIVRGFSGHSEFVGAFGYTLRANMEIEGFFDITGEYPYSLAEHEAQHLILNLFRNQDAICEDVKFFEFDITSLDEEYFADGERLVVAKVSGEIEMPVLMTV